MVTLQTADSALKTFYLDAVTKEIDEKGSAFYAMIEKTSANVVGKSVTKVVKTGMSGGVGAGLEDGTLPKGDNGEYVALTAPLKNLYGTIEITDKALRASASNEGAFVDLLNEEMQTLVQSAKYNFGRMLFGDGSGYLARVSSTLNAQELRMDTVANLEAGMCVDFWFEDIIVHEGAKIISVDRAAKKIKLQTNGYDLTQLDTDTAIALHGAKPYCDLTGLAAIFSSEDIYGVDREKAYMKPYIQESVGDIDEEVVQRAMDEVESASGSPVDLIICSWGVRRALMNAFKARNYPITTVKFGESASALSINGVPVVVDRFCPEGTMYLLNTKDFKLCQLCDWQWMEGEDGKILKQVPGKPVYTATLVKYAELICQKPCGQAALKGINEA